MGNFNSNLLSLLAKDVIISTSVNDQLHGQIVSVEDDCVIFQMADQKKILNLAHIVYVIPKDSIVA